MLGAPRCPSVARVQHPAQLQRQPRLDDPSRGFPEASRLGPGPRRRFLRLMLPELAPGGPTGVGAPRCRNRAVLRGCDYASREGPASFAIFCFV